MTAGIVLANGGIALVDEADLPLLRPYRWTRRSRGPGAYAGCYVPGTPPLQLSMHRIVMDAAPGQTIDHIDGDGLNNRRSNLRFVTTLQNRRNAMKHTVGSSPFKGVCKHGLRWRAQIYDKNRFDGMPFTIGFFDTEADAARAYDAVARLLFQEHARLNFPRPGEQCALPSAPPPDAPSPAPQAAA